MKTITGAETGYLVVADSFYRRDPAALMAVFYPTDLAPSYWHRDELLKYCILSVANFNKSQLEHSSKRIAKKLLER